jgi:predicted Zn-dependent protease
MERIMTVDLFRRTSRLACAVAGAFLGLAAIAPAAGGFGQAQAPPPAPASPPAPGQSSFEGLFQSGVAALSAKSFAAAEEAFRQCRELEPKNFRALMGLVQTYQAQSKFEQAIHLLETELAADPANQALMVTLGNMYVGTHKWDQGILQYQKVLDATDKKTKTAGELYFAIGEACRQKGDLTSAIAALRNARLTLPDDARVLTTLAMMLEAVSSWEAQQADEDALRVAPDNPILLNNLAFSLAEHGGDLDRALSMARRARQLLPTMLEISDTLGWIYLKKNMAYEARAAFAPLVHEQPGNATFRDHLSKALEWGNAAPPALQALVKALREKPTDANQSLVLKLLQASGLPVSR